MWLSWLDRHPIDKRVTGSIPGQVAGSIPGCSVYEKAINRYFSLMSLSPPPPLTHTLFLKAVKKCPQVRKKTLYYIKSKNK